jgi:tetratricopeptide (TPR) repeat protein
METELEVFVSSSMKEFRAERTMLRQVIPTLSQSIVTLKAWVYEEDAYASEQTIQDLYTRQLQSAELYIGIFGTLYGKYTIDEFNIATDWGIPRLIFVRNLGAGERRDKELDDFLRTVGDVEEGQLAPFYFNDLGQLKTAVIHSIEHWLTNRILHRSGSNTAILATHRDMLEDLPQRLIGRDELMAEINPLLDRAETVLLQGLGGMGKTALAATLAAQRINGHPVLWQRLGSETPDAVFESIARPFNAQQAIAAAKDEEKRGIIRQLLLNAQVGLVVLDDAWDGKALNMILRAIPRSLPVLVTSRHRYGIGNVIKVGELRPEDALETLGYYANMDYTGDTNAAVLCQILGYHAFALEVAGRTMNSADLTPNELMKRIADNPTRLEVPEGFALEGRRNVADLLEASLTLLDNETQRVFLAMGAFFAKRMTAEMLTLYFMDVPEVTPQMLAEIRWRVPELANRDDIELRRIIFRQVIVPQLHIDTSQVEKALDKLVMRGLAEREREDERNVTHYRLHDLAYSYAKAKNSEENRRRSLMACLIYITRYKEPNPANFRALRPEMDNLMNAATWAMGAGLYEEVEVFVDVLYIGGGQAGFLFRQGLYAQSITLIEQAIQAASEQGNKYNQGSHLGNLGIAYRNLGRVEQAIRCYEQALAIRREIGDRQGEGNDLGNLGTAYLSLGQLEQAIRYFEQALAISREIGDRYGEGNDLGNLGNAYFILGQMERSIQYYEQSLILIRESGDKLVEGNLLGNLGNVYRNLGQIEQAIRYYQQALSISREVGDRQGEGNRLGSLGNAYSNLGQAEQAIQYYKQALAISREIGDRRMEETCLGNLGNTYADLRQVEQAIRYYEEALTIDREIGDRMGEGSDLRNIGALYDAQGDASVQAGAYTSAQQDYQRALDYYQQARIIFVEIGTPHLIRRCEERIARVQAKLAGRR